MKLTGSFDFDETAGKCRHIVVAFFAHLQNRGIPSSLEMYDKTHSWKAAIPHHDSNKLYVEFYQSGEAPLPEHMPGAHDALLEMMESCELHITTARDPFTLASIDSHIRNVLFPQVPLASLYGCGGGVKKAPRLIDLGAQFHIDDSAAEIESLLHIPGLTLIQFPYISEHGSRIINHPNVIRLHTCDRVNKDHPDQVYRRAWQQAKRIVKRMAKRPSLKHRVA